jgi:hypothetical protein
MSGIIGKNASRSSGVIGTAAGGIASLAADSSPQLGGFLDAAGNYIQMEKGGDISSASPTVIDTDGDFFAVSGTTNFSAFTVAADRHFFLEFGGALTMTHGAGTLDLPGAANITTAASDVGEFVSTAANVVTCVNYTKRDGTAVVAAGGAFETGALAHLDTGQTIVTGTHTKINLPTEVYDLDGDFDSSTNYRFIPPVTGEYVVIGQVGWANGTVDQKRYTSQIFVAGSLKAYIRVHASGTRELSIPVCGIFQLTATTDYVELYVYHTEGADTNVSSGAETTFLSVHRIS